MKNLNEIKLEFSGWEFGSGDSEDIEVYITESGSVVAEMLLSKLLDRRISIVDMMKFEEMLENFEK